MKNPNLLSKGLMLSFFVLVNCSVKKENPPVSVKAQQIIKTKDLFSAILDSDIKAVKKSIGSGANVNAYDIDGYPALTRGVQVGNPIIVNDLLESGAKVFQPLRHDPKKTVFDSLDQNKPEIVRLIETEALRLSLEAERLIHRKAFSEALVFFKSNDLPSNLLLPRTQKTALLFASQKYSKEDDLDFLMELLNSNNTEGPHLESISQEMLRLSSEIKDPDFLSNLLSKYIEHNTSHHFSRLTTLDYDIYWLEQKLAILRSKNQTPKISDVNRSVLSSQMQPTPEDQAQVRKLVAEVLEIQTQGTDKNNFIKDLLKKIIEKVSEDIQFMTWIDDIVTLWMSKNLPETEYVFNNLALTLIQSIGHHKSYNLHKVSETLDNLSLFAPITFKLEEVFSFILDSDSFKDLQKKELLKLASQKVGVLPENLLSIAIKNGGYKSLDLILKLGLNLNPRNQKDSVLTAVESTSSANEALSILKTLKDFNVPFNSEFAIEALSIAFDKVWSQKRDFKEVILLILNTEPLFANIENPKIQELVKKVLDQTSQNPENWDLLNFVFSQIPSSFRYSKFIKYPKAEKALEIKMSLVWDLILTLFEVSKKESNIESLMFFLDNAIQRFPEEKASMGLVLENSTLNTEENLTHNMIPLSLLFSIPENVTKDYLFGPEEYNQVRNYQKLEAKEISWSTFYSSEFYRYYSQNLDFWKSVSDVLIKNSKTSISLKDNVSHLQFIGILASARKFKVHPKLLSVFPVQKFNLDPKNKTCIIENHSKPQGTISHSQWTSLGTFQVLDHLSLLSCNYWDSQEGQVLSSSEINFIRDYIRNNFETPKNTDSDNLVNEAGLSTYNIDRVECQYLDESSIGDEPQKELGLDILKDAFQTSSQRVNVRNPNFKFTQKNSSPYLQSYYSSLGIYSKNDKEEVGTQLEVDISSNTDKATATKSFVIQTKKTTKCDVYKYRYDFHYRAKKEFLEKWFQCAKDKNKQNLIKLFESLSKEYNLSPNSYSDSKIKLCRI